MLVIIFFTKKKRLKVGQMIQMGHLNKRRGHTNNDMAKKNNKGQQNK